jgi:Calx-beta domain/Right handed beta helix region
MRIAGRALAPLLLAAAPLQAQNAVSLVSVSGYGNFHAGGVVLTVSGDANGNAAAALEWRQGAGAFQPGHPLSRIDTTHFAGSLFWLDPATAYEARVTLSDPDGVNGPATATTPVVTRADQLAEPSLRTLYVAPNGNDNNPGTDPGAPKQTIQGAADVAQAGDLILIQPGVYRESVNVPASGTAAQPIVFRGNAPGAILDGADGAIAAGVAWTPTAGGTYSYATGFDTGHVVTEQGRLYRYGSLAELQALAAGAPGGFYFDGTLLFVKFSDQSAPAAHTMSVARFEDGFLIDGRSFVRVESLEIRHYGAGDYGKGVYLRYSSDCAVRSCNIHEVEASGVWIKGGDRHLVEENQLWDTSIFNWPWDLTKGSSAEGNGVVFSDDVGRGHVVRRNTIYGSFNGMGPCGSAPPPSGVTNETDLYENTLYQHTDDGFEPEGYCSNVRIWGNSVRDVHMAFAVAPAAPGPVYILRNVAFRFGNTRTSQVDGYTASALKINSGYPDPIGPLFLYHNTLLTDAPGTDAFALLNPGESTYIVARDNVVAGTQYALYKVNPVVWNGNGDDFFTTDPSRFVNWLGTHYDTLGAYQSALGQELLGISAQPQLVDPVAGDFTPAAGSPLIDAGIVLPGIDDGYLGAAPDIGAVETGGLPTVSIADASGNEGTSALFSVTLSAPSAGTVTVSYATSDGTAVAPGDYTAASGTLSLAPGETSASLPVALAADGLNEMDETFGVTLSAPTGAILGDAQAVGTILDNDEAPTVSIDNVSVQEGTCVPGSAAFTVTLSGPSGQPASVNYATFDETATGGSDYVPVAGTLSFAPGATTGTIAVQITGDFVDENDEVFDVVLSMPVNLNIMNGFGAGTILDDDGPGSGIELSHGSSLVASLESPGGTLDEDVYQLAQQPHDSYEVMVDGLSGDVVPIVLQRVACGGGPVQNGGGTGSSQSLRFENATGSIVANQTIHVRSGGCSVDCDAADVYRIRLRESTLRAARFNNSSTQITVLVLQSAAPYAIAGHVWLWTTSGSPAGNQALTVPPHGTVVLNTASVAPGQSGSLTLSHEGAYGDLSGKAVAVEPATGFTFDTPLQSRPR